MFFLIGVVCILAQDSHLTANQQIIQKNLELVQKCSISQEEMNLVKLDIILEIKEHYKKIYSQLQYYSDRFNSFYSFIDQSKLNNKASANYNKVLKNDPAYRNLMISRQQDYALNEKFSKDQKFDEDQLLEIALKIQSFDVSRIRSKQSKQHMLNINDILKLIMDHNELYNKAASQFPNKVDQSKLERVNKCLQNGNEMQDEQKNRKGNTKDLPDHQKK